MSEAKFVSIGLSKTDIKVVLKSPEHEAELLKLITETSCDEAIGRCVHQLSINIVKKQVSDVARSTLVSYLKDRKILSVKQLKCALAYFKKLGDSTDVDHDALSAQSGVGIVVTQEQIDKVVGEAVSSAKSWNDMGKLLGKLTRDDALKWADGADIRSAVVASLTAKFGAEPEKPKKKGKGGKKSAVVAPAVEDVAVVVRPETPFESARVLHLASKFLGQRVRLRGWVAHLRRQKKVLFVILRDAGSGYVQCVLAGSLARTQEALDLKLEASVMLYGVVTKVPEGADAEGGIEVQCDFMDVVGRVDSDVTAIVNHESLDDTKIQQRHIVLRGRRQAAYLRLRSLAMHCMRGHFFDDHYYEVTPSTIVQTSCEGGSDLFAFDYFGEEAYLTQSSQLYLETAIPSIGKVFCILPSFRAEKSRTRRHLAEYTHLEAELPWITFEDLLNAIEFLMVDTVERIMALPEARALMKEVNPEFKPLKRPFRRMSYHEAVNFCREHNITKVDDTGAPTDELYEHGEDLPENAERKMLALINEPIFLYRFPVPLKAFYMSKTADDPTVTESVDLLLPGVGEVVGGSMRISDHEELMAAYKREKLDPEDYYWYIDQRRFGSVSHGGYGLGVERFLVWLFGDDHIKNVCMFPRYRGTAKP